MPDTKFEISELKKENIDDIYFISTLCFPKPWLRESFEMEYNNDIARYIVAIKDNKVIGYGGVWFVVDEGHITNIAVHPDYRRQGAASAILKNLISLCMESSINSMMLEVRKSNLPAQKLYTNFGFKPEGIRKKYYDHIEDAIIMWKRDM